MAARGYLGRPQKWGPLRFSLPAAAALLSLGGELQHPSRLPAEGAAASRAGRRGPA